MPDPTQTDDDVLVIDPDVVAALRRQLPAVAARTVAAVVAEIDEYADPLQGRMAAKIIEAVRVALDAFLRMIEHADPGEALRPALDGAYGLGGGEARSGRSIDALLGAYRVGARTAWHEWGGAAVAARVPPEMIVRFAEQVFAYIDQLSAASVAGHGDELATSGRVREMYRERLGRALLSAAPPDELVEHAERADWEQPKTLTVLLVGAERARFLAGALEPRTLNLAADVIDEGLPGDLRVLLVPDTGQPRSAVWRALAQEPAVVGPAKPWTEVSRSYQRAVRVLRLRGMQPGGLDTEGLLTELVLTADTDALADLRARALAPLAELPDATAERLTETLLSWLLHQGRRNDVAEHLLIHPQTVRYRMTQLRSLYGDILQDPDQVLGLILALGARPPDLDPPTSG
ncbi:PucR family transcriptional regulator [Pseudonocardia sp.]|uniref:PucR family transcriptional regulator n=1 Tax=Pseudonocardia sp. TaxID=60912 RepID=UPI0026075F6D|nr:PucR family transcriptional regulator [Pseudonocardia sp.]